MPDVEFAALLGKRIKELRTSLGYTQEELAHKAGYADKTMISKIEAGKTEPPASKLSDFAAALDTNVAFLMGWPSGMKDLSQDEFELLMLYRNATDLAKGIAIGALKTSQEDTALSAG